ncbi:MAG: regulatory protein RecX [Candidatus Saccharibacteria bacterium]
MENRTQFKQAYDKAIELLSRRTHTAEELRRKLLRRKIADPAVVEDVIAKLKELRFLNDADAARFYLESLIRYKSFGYFGLLQKLLLKGVAKSAAGELLDELLDLDTEAAIARKLLGKQAKSKQPGKQRAAAMLMRKGFRSQTIAKVLPDLEGGL